jgi:hypothetical protein
MDVVREIMEFYYRKWDDRWCPFQVECRHCMQKKRKKENFYFISSLTWRWGEDPHHYWVDSCIYIC